MDTLQFINKAVSKDVTRYNLTSAYYGKEMLVATDGHRMHFRKHLTPSDKAYHLDPTIQADYPDCEMVINQLCTKEVCKQDLALSDSELKELRAIAALIGRKAEVFTQLTVTKDLLSLEVKHGGINLTWNKELSGLGAEFSGWYNIRYLIEALDYTIDRFKTAQLSIYYYGDLKPLKIEHIDTCSAIVMPVRN